MKIATLNVNSIRVRLPHVLRYLKSAKPDVLLMQELKCLTEQFPTEEISDAGYNSAVLGQKTYNGVAALSRHPIDEVVEGLPGDKDDTQSRWVEIVVRGVRYVSLYLPNGNPIGTEKFDFKIAWMDRMIDRAKALLEAEEDFVFGGDFNVCPTDEDVYDAQGFSTDALCQPESRAKWRELKYLGLTEAFNALHPDEVGAYTYWGYQGGAWRRGNGLRIDHFFLSPHMADRLVACDVDKDVRAEEKASDHTVLWCELGEADSAPSHFP